MRRPGIEGGMSRLEKKHPLAIRWFHWINFPLLAVMIWSGILIYWAWPAYAPVKLEQTTWRALHVNNRLAEGMALHFFFMWLFGVNGVLYVLYVLISGEWRKAKTKFNRMQRLAYLAIVLMGAGSLLSGLAIYKPVQFSWLAWLMGGYQGARFVHFWLTVGYVAFFLVHVAQVVRAGWNNFRAMIIGVEVVND
ncbi:MAG TPA: cytochrome b/b6 domain-containing protein [Thermoanaerobaculia bacterium]|nr:cytochrome b/b6 domain-containing protein [Thermoanaerobaculia bacterium]